jgi:hypothetical protein
MNSDSPLPSGLGGNQVEHLVVGLRRWVPKLWHTYGVMVRQPRTYLRSIGTGQSLAGVVGPGTFWATNSVVAKAISALHHGESVRRSCVGATSDFGGLAVGTALCALFLSSILDIRGWRGFRRMLRVLFTGSILFVPMSLAAIIPAPENLFAYYMSPAILGTGEVGWAAFIGPAVQLVLLIAWFAWAGFGIRQVFRKSKASITLCTLSIPAFMMAGALLLVGVVGLHNLRAQVSIAWNTWRPAEAALMKRPPDYVASGQSFTALYESKIFLDRSIRINAKIGSVGAGLAAWSVAMNLPEAEAQFYAAQTNAIARNTDAAVQALSDGIALVDARGDAWRSMTRSARSQVSDIRRMMASQDYSPWEAKGRKWKSQLVLDALTWPSVFP